MENFGTIRRSALDLATPCNFMTPALTLVASVHQDFSMSPFTLLLFEVDSFLVYIRGVQTFLFLDGVQFQSLLSRVLITTKTHRDHWNLVTLSRGFC